MEIIIVVFIALFICALGSMFCYVPFQILKNNYNIRNNGIKTTAKIIRSSEELLLQNRESLNKNYVNTNFPTISFRDIDGHEVIEKLEIGKPIKWKKSHIKIIYLKKNDDYFIIPQGYWMTTVFPIIFVLFGLCMISFGVYMVVVNL